jgi:type III secretory pathway lipoprotein EscJ
MVKTSGFFRLKSILFFLLTAILLAGCSARKVQTVKVESEANQIIDVLGENGIRARKNEVGEGERKSFEILVNGDEEAVAAAIQLMEDHCLGRPDPPEPEGGAVITSIEVEKAREQRRMKMNIESQLRKLPGVTCVDVNFVPPQDRSLAINPYPSTASVLVNYKTQTFPVGKDDIASLVARSVPALQPENVSVVISAKPLRPLPDNKIAYNFTRIALVSGIGLATILAFVSVVFVLRKKRRNQPDEPEEFSDYLEKESPNEKTLLDERYDFDDDDEEEERHP